MVALLGYKPSKFELDQIMYEHRDCNGLSVQQLHTFVNCQLNLMDDNEKLRQVFVAFDSSCNGFISLEDFRKAVRAVAPYISLLYIDELFSICDRDHIGRLSFRDFVFFMKTKVY